MNVIDFLKAVDNQIKKSKPYYWNCFGTSCNEIGAVFEKKDKFNHGFSTECCFDTITSQIYKIEMWDHDYHHAYRWIDPDYLEAYKEACGDNIDFTYAMDEFDYEDISYLEILGKIQHSEPEQHVPPVFNRAGSVFDTTSLLWDRQDNRPYFHTLDIQHRKQIGGSCVSTGLSLLTKEEPIAIRAQINTQDPISWSNYLKRFGMKLAYCPTDLRRLRHYKSQLLAMDDLFAKPVILS